MPVSEILLLVLAGFAAGGMNALAGGGTFFSFPALLAAGLPPVTANATNAVALWPASLAGAWAARDSLRPLGRYLLPLLAAGLAGRIERVQRQQREAARAARWAGHRHRYAGVRPMRDIGAVLQNGLREAAGRVAGAWAGPAQFAA